MKVKSGNICSILLLAGCLSVPLSSAYATMTLQEFHKAPNKRALVEGIINSEPLPGYTLEESQDFLWKYVSHVISGKLTDFEVHKGYVWLMVKMVAKGYDGFTINDLELLNHHLEQLQASGSLTPEDQRKNMHAQEIVRYKLHHFMDPLIDLFIK